MGQALECLVQTGDNDNVRLPSSRMDDDNQPPSLKSPEGAPGRQIVQAGLSFVLLLHVLSFDGPNIHLLLGESQFFIFFCA